MMKPKKAVAAAFFSLLLGLLVWEGISRISFNVDILRLLPTHLKQVEGLSLFLKNFALPEELIITVEGSTPEQAEHAAGEMATILSRHQDLVKTAVAEAPWDAKPERLTEFLTFLLINQKPEKNQEILENLSPANAKSTLEETVERLNSSMDPLEMAILPYDPYRILGSLSEGVFSKMSGQSEFSSKDGMFRIVYVHAKSEFANYQEMGVWIDQIKSLCAPIAAKHQVQLGYTGEPAFVAEISKDMQRDMALSAPIALMLIGLIFWICYQRFLPLIVLLLMLQLIFVLTLGAAGLLLNELTVIGAGFASVMIGLSVDYGFFIYQKSLTHNGNTRSLQWDCLQSIFWTSGTTAAAFFALNFSSLPGLSQLGSMVGIGVCIGAVVMLGLFAPLALWLKKRASATARVSWLEGVFASAKFLRGGLWVTLILVGISLGALIFKGLPEADFSAATFRPRHSESHNALGKIHQRLQDDRGFLSLIVTGQDEDEVHGRLLNVESVLESAEKRGEIRSFFLPLPIWPNGESQAANLKSLNWLAKESPRLKNQLLESAFTEEAFLLSESVFQRAALWKDAPVPLWPTDEASAWIMRRIARHGPDQCLALGIVDPASGKEEALVESLASPGVHLVSWAALGAELQKTLPAEILEVSLWLLGGILVILFIALRDWRAIALFLFTTFLVLACLAGVMSWLDMNWGFFNLAAVLLLLGTGTDYSILILLSFKRFHNAEAAQRQLSAVIFLCCSSSMAGFATLGLASNMGLSALGRTCALGLLIDGLISLFILPHLCQIFLPKKPPREGNLGS